MIEDEDRDFHFSKRPDRIYVSKSFPDMLTGAKLRIASKVIDSEEGLAFAVVQNDVSVRITPSGRQEIKATFLEDSRRITVLTIQKFNARSGPAERQYFSFVGSEIERLLKFILSVKTLDLEGGEKLRVSDDQLAEIILSEVQARRLFEERRRAMKYFDTSTASPH